MQYRAGSHDKHFRATSEALTTDDIANAFSAYIEGKADWHGPWTWERVEFAEDFEGDLGYDNAYLINGEVYEKVAVGAEQTPLALSADKCPGCRVGVGQYHEPGCEFEECPRCHDPICGCDCE